VRLGSSSVAPKRTYHPCWYIFLEMSERMNDRTIAHFDAWVRCQAIPRPRFLADTTRTALTKQRLSGARRVSSSRKSILAKRLPHLSSKRLLAMSSAFAERVRRCPFGNLQSNKLRWSTSDEVLSLQTFRVFEVSTGNLIQRGEESELGLEPKWCMLCEQ
jgi:hypothetical protein